MKHDRFLNRFKWMLPSYIFSHRQPGCNIARLRVYATLTRLGGPKSSVNHGARRQGRQSWELLSTRQSTSDLRYRRSTSAGQCMRIVLKRFAKMSDLSTIMQIPALTNLSGLKRVLPAATPNAFLKQRVGCFILSSKLVLHSRIASGEPKSGQFATGPKWASVRLTQSHNTV